jgi:AhpD family alkylhydroperoxidase
VRDVGSLFVALSVLLVIAAFSLRRGTVLAASVAWLLYAVPHFVWHLFNLEPYGTFDAVANTVALAGTVVGGVSVLALALRREPRPAAAPGDGGGARIALVGDERAGLLARAAYRYSRREFGAVTEPLRLYAHHPRILSGYAGLEYATERADRVPRRLKVLAATKAAALAGCEFCMDIGSMISTKHGLTEEQLRALPAYSASDLFSEDEKLVLDLAVGMSRTPVDVSEELFARLRERFDEAQLVELANEIAVENYRARFDWAFGVGSQGFTEGAFCVRPEPAPEAAPAG